MSPQEKKPFRLLPASWIEAVLRLSDRLSRPLVRLEVSPNALSVLGLVAGVAVGLFYALERPGWAAASILVCGVLDILDGKVATNGGWRSDFGAMLDSSLDRYAEFFMFAGLACHFRHGWGLWLTVFAFLGSSMVSYTRARAEGLGVECRVGPMQRAERFVLLFVGTVAGIVFGALDPVLVAVVAVIAVVSHFTAVQRILCVRQAGRGGTTPKEN